jgi:hypothetical protein
MVEEKELGLNISDRPTGSGDEPRGAHFKPKIM